jgi:hypothetical protein
MLHPQARNRLGNEPDKISDDGGPDVEDPLNLHVIQSHAEYPHEGDNTPAISLPSDSQRSEVGPTKTVLETR